METKIKVKIKRLKSASIQISLGHMGIKWTEGCSSKSSQVSKTLLFPFI